MSSTQIEDPGIVHIVTEAHDDHVVFRPSMSEFKKQVELERIPNLLSRSVGYWTGEHPELKVRSTLGIVEDGYTVAIHVWVDRRDEV